MRRSRRDDGEGLAFPRLGAQGPDWIEYEYQVRWSLRDGDTLSVPAASRNGRRPETRAVALTPPFEKRVIEIDATARSSPPTARHRHRGDRLHARRQALGCSAKPSCARPTPRRRPASPCIGIAAQTRSCAFRGMGHQAGWNARWTCSTPSYLLPDAAGPVARQPEDSSHDTAVTSIAAVSLGILLVLVGALAPLGRAGAADPDRSRHARRESLVFPARRRSPKTYVYLPSSARLATDDNGRPQFSFVRYRRRSRNPLRRRRNRSTRRVAVAFFTFSSRSKRRQRRSPPRRPRCVETLKDNDVTLRGPSCSRTAVRAGLVGREPAEWIPRTDDARDRPSAGPRRQPPGVFVRAEPGAGHAAAQVDGDEDAGRLHRLRHDVHRPE